MFDKYEVSINKFGTLFFRTQDGYKITFMLQKHPEIFINRYTGYVVYKPGQMFDCFRSESLENCLEYVRLQQVNKDFYYND